MTKSASIGKAAEMPTLVKPMLATLVNDPFDGEDWLFEIKWDGFRALTKLESQKVKIISRSGQSFNSRFSLIVEELEKLSIEAWLDGEIVVLDEKGKPSFQLLQNYARRPEGTLVYYLFDLLYLNGKDLQDLPLIERKAVLKSILPKNNPTIRYCEHVAQKGKAFFKAVVEQEIEGMMAKRSDSRYLEGKRTQSWLKIKTHLRQEALICGFTQPKGSRKFFGSLLLGVYENQVLTYVGHAGTGFDRQKLAEINARLSHYIQCSCPFPSPPKIGGSITWIKPVLVCEISFAEWTKGGVMRQAVFIDFRDDKKPKEIVREKQISIRE